MMKSQRRAQRMTMLAMILMSAGCETVRQGVASAGLCPAPVVEIRPSTFCQSYRPIEARADDPAAQPGTDAFDQWWDDLPGKIGTENDRRTRGNNRAYQVNCL